MPDAVDGFSCGEFLQSVYGPDAGGHAGIGGTPRDKQYDVDNDARELALKLAIVLA